GCHAKEAAAVLIDFSRLLVHRDVSLFGKRAAAPRPAITIDGCEASDFQRLDLGDCADRNLNAGALPQEHPTSRNRQAAGGRSLRDRILPDDRENSEPGSRSADARLISMVRLTRWPR